MQIKLKQVNHDLHVDDDDDQDEQLMLSIFKLEKSYQNKEFLIPFHLMDSNY